ncbi:MAG: threonylcarbamoyl-AMP synthase [Anaerolinea sp.]|nr:threonylcarbamoyl-AMP synthase [Anaerolinea sp.]
MAEANTIPVTTTALLDARQPGALEEAAARLRQGDLVAFPTDTVYGLGALVWNAASVARIYQAKARPPEKAIPVLLAGVAQLALLGVEATPLLLRLAERFWPGPLTLVARCDARVPEIVTAGTLTVAVRMPDHAAALRLFDLVGQPLAATSANLSGHTNPLTASDVMAQLGGRIEAVVDGGACPGGVPSTVLDCSVSPPRILRPGPVTAQDLRFMGAELAFVEG